MTNTPTMDQMKGVIPYLTIDGAAKAVEFYKTAFGAEDMGQMLAEDGNRLMHAQVLINGGSLMLNDPFPEMGYPAGQSTTVMQLVVSDGDAWWSRAIAAGCTEKMPFATAPWGDRYGQMTDPFGVTWAINEPGS